MLLRCPIFWRLLSDDPSCDRLAVFVRCVACDWLCLFVLLDVLLV